MTLLYQTLQIQALELLAREQAQLSESDLMQSAGAASLGCLRQCWPQASKVIVCCGQGNNGGDGWVVARLAHEAGLDVTVVLLAEPEVFVGCAKNAYLECEALRIPMTSYHQDMIFEADVLVDALLGSGLNRDVTGHYAHAIKDINACTAPVLSLDVPSGLDSNQGAILGTAVEADVTMTFIGMKPGLMTAKGPAYAGEIYCDRLGLPDAVFDQVPAFASCLVREDFSQILPRRKKDAHKGDFGHVLVIGGDYGMGGAVRMAAEAALRVGAGLVSVATRPEHVAVVSGSRPEIMCHQVAQAQDLDVLLERSTVVVIGPGLGQSEWAYALWDYVMQHAHPKVLDADALNLLAQHPRACDGSVLTPHPGEASRLLGQTVQDVQDHRFDSARALVQRYHGTVVLKGMGTVIQTDSVSARVCTAGNPGMASAGLGDILSGVIGGLLAQGIALTEAASLGVFVHAQAGDLAAKEEGERGLLATDLLSHLRQLVNVDEN